MDYQFVEVNYNGRNIKYKVYNGTYYNFDTPDDVVRILDYAINNNVRIRVFYGSDDGRDWMERYDTMGTVSRSCGPVKIPLLLRNSRSIGGASILDACIVKITIDKKTVYQAENYHLPDMDIQRSDDSFFYELYADGKCVGAFDTKKQAENAMAFYKGLRNTEK